ncbi:hypothetical protein BY998_107162, partial [Methylobacterium sp. B4]
MPRLVSIVSRKTYADLRLSLVEQNLLQGIPSRRTAKASPKSRRRYHGAPPGLRKSLSVVISRSRSKAPAGPKPLRPGPKPLRLGRNRLAVPSRPELYEAGPHARGSPIGLHPRASTPRSILRRARSLFDRCRQPVRRSARPIHPSHPEVSPASVRSLKGDLPKTAAVPRSPFEAAPRHRRTSEGLGTREPNRPSDARPPCHEKCPLGQVLDGSVRAGSDGQDRIRANRIRAASSKLVSRCTILRRTNDPYVEIYSKSLSWLSIGVEKGPGIGVQKGPTGGMVSIDRRRSGRR